MTFNDYFAQLLPAKSPAMDLLHSSLAIKSRRLFFAVLLVGFEQFHCLPVGAGCDAYKIGCHRGGVCVLVEPLGEQLLIGETIGKT